MEWQLPEYNLRMMLPEIFLFLWALVVITFDLVTKRKTGSAVGYLSLLGLLITGFILSVTGYGRGFTTMFFNDPMSLFFKIIFLGAAFMAIASSFGITRQTVQTQYPKCSRSTAGNTMRLSVSVLTVVAFISRVLISQARTVTIVAYAM